MKNSGKAHPHGIKASLFVVDAHVSWSSPLLSLYGTSWWMQKKKIQRGLNTKGQEGKRPREGRETTLGTTSPWAGCNSTWGGNTP